MSRRHPMDKRGRQHSLRRASSESFSWKPYLFVIAGNLIRNETEEREAALQRFLKGWRATSSRLVASKPSRSASSALGEPPARAVPGPTLGSFTSARGAGR
jgi:hypothetical protein